MYEIDWIRNTYIPPYIELYFSYDSCVLCHANQRLLTVHFLHRADKVLRVLEAHEPVPFALARPLVPDHFGALEGGELVERARQQLVVDVVPEIAAEDAEVVLRPVGQGHIFPRLATGDADRLLFSRRQENDDGLFNNILERVYDDIIDGNYK